MFLNLRMHIPSDYAISLLHIQPQHKEVNWQNLIGALFEKVQNNLNVHQYEKDN